MAHRRREFYEDRGARISILAGISPRPETLAQTAHARPKNSLADGAGHTFLSIADRMHELVPSSGSDAWAGSSAGGSPIGGGRSLMVCLRARRAFPHATWRVGSRVLCLRVRAPRSGLSRPVRHAPQRAAP